MSTYFTSLFLAKVGSGGNTPRTVNTISGKFSCGSLPQIILIWVFRKILPEIPWLTSPMTALLIHQQEKRLYELICTDEQKSDLSHSGVRQKMTSSLQKKRKEDFRILLPDIQNFKSQTKTAGDGIEKATLSMSHLTDFEIFLCGVCVTIFVIGFKTFVKEIFMGEFRKKEEKQEMSNL